MMLIDSHCHLYLEEFGEDIENVMQRAQNEGVSRIYLPAIEKKYAPDMEKMENRYPGCCFAMTGLHPCSVKENYEEELRFVEQSLTKRKFAAVGEIGLDFYWDRTFTLQQLEAFRSQIELAKAYQIPIVIHSRESLPDTIRVVRDHQDGKLKGIFHCFSDTREKALEIIDLGFYLGIGGVVTFKNSRLPAEIKDISLKHMVLETDAPYLTPAPFRGKRNEPAHLKYIVQKLAELKEISTEEVARQTTENALEIFGS